MLDMRGRASTVGDATDVCFFLSFSFGELANIEVVDW